MTYKTLLLQLVLPILVVLAICLPLDTIVGDDRPIGFAVIAAGLLAFAFFAGHQTSAGEPGTSDRSLRQAFAAAIIIQYLLLVGTVAFFRQGDQLPPITQTILSSFTAIVGVVVAFYFGVSAYVQTQKGTRADVKRTSASETPKTSEPAA